MKVHPTADWNLHSCARVSNREIKRQKENERFSVCVCIEDKRVISDCVHWLVYLNSVGVCRSVLVLAALQDDCLSAGLDGFISLAYLTHSIPVLEHCR